VKGATLIRNNGRAVFNDTVTVILDEDTIVKRQLSQDAFTIQDISAGQRLTVFGDLTNSDMDSLELNATGANQGYVRMELTTVRGTVVDQDPSLSLDLQSINTCRIGIFDFSGTGTESENDADPENYEISTGTLNISLFGQGDTLKVIGFVNGFGQAPADFIAQTVVDVTDVRSFMRVTWAPASAAPFEILSSEKIVITQQHHGKFHHLGRSGVIVNLDDLSSLTTIQPVSAGQGRFVVKYRESNQFYSTFESFVSGLEGLIEDGKKMQSMFATGSFDQTNAILTADCIEFKVK
jgi:hypothetical protein